jgi:hypothetical protein
MELLMELKDKLTEEQWEYYREKVEAEDKRTMMMFRVYFSSKDMNDLVNSMERQFAKAKK